MRKTKSIIFIMILTIFMFTFAGCKAKDATISFNDGFSLDKVYDGKPVKAPTSENYTTTSNGEVMVEWLMGAEVLKEAPSESGNYKVKIYVEQTKKFKACEAFLEFKISKINGVIEFVDGYNLNKVYDGKEVKTPTLNDINTNLNLEKIEVEWYEGSKKLDKAPIDAGTYKVKVIATESTNYTSATVEKEFTISKMEGEIKFKGGTNLDKTYDGKKLDDLTSKLITKNKEIEFKWYQGEKELTAAPTEAGSYKVKAIGKADKNYTECSCELAFTINKAVHELKFKDDFNLDKTYDGKKITYNKDNHISTSKEFKVEFYRGEEKLTEEPINAGTYKIKVTALEDKNYKEQVIEKEFTIAKANGEIKLKEGFSMDKKYDDKPATLPLLKDLTTTATSLNYEFMKGEAKLTSNPKDTGTYKVTIIGLENENYLEARIDLDFTISKADGAIKINEGFKLDKIYDGKKINPITKENYTTQNSAVEVSYYKGKEKLNEAPINAGTYTLKLNALANLNYTAASCEMTFTISKAQGSITILENFVKEKTYDTKPAKDPLDATFTYIGSKPTFSWHNGEDSTLTTPPTDAGSYILLLTQKENDNYLGSSKSITYEIKKLAAEIKFNDNFVREHTYNEEPAKDPLADTYSYVGPAPIIEWFEGDTKLSTPPTDAGTYKIKFAINNDNNHLGAFASIEYKINKAKPVINYTDPADKIYDGLPIDLSGYKNATTNSGGSLNVSILNSKGERIKEYTDEFPEIITAEIYTIILHSKESKNYLNDYATTSFKISKAVNTIDFKDGIYESFNKAYDGIAPKVTTSDVVTNSNAPIVIEYLDAQTLEVLSEAPKDTGKYIVRISQVECENYLEGTNQFTYEITKATNTIDFKDVNYELFNKTYDGIAPTITSSNVSTNSNAPIVIEYLDAQTLEVLSEAPKDAKMYIVRISQVENENYQSGSTQFTYTITKAAPTINYYTPLSKVYDGEAIIIPGVNTITSNSEGKRSMQITCGEAILKAFGNETIPEIINSGTYTIEIKIAETTNYLAIKWFGEFTISKVSNTLDFKDGIYESFNKVYDGIAPKVTTSDVVTNSNAPIVIEYLNAETIEVLSEAPKDAGMYIVRISQVECENYLEGTNQFSYEITKVNTTINYQAPTGKTYDRLAIVIPGIDTITSNSEGIRSMQIRCGDVIIKAFDNETMPEIINAGTYRIDVRIAETTNYTSTSAFCEFTIDKAESNVEATFEPLSVYNGEERIFDEGDDYHVTGELSNSYIYYKGDYEIHPTHPTEVTPIDAAEYVFVVKVEETTNYKESKHVFPFTIQKVTLDAFTYTKTLDYSTTGNYEVILKTSDAAKILANDEIKLRLTPVQNGVTTFNSTSNYSQNKLLVTSYNDNYSLENVTIILNVLSASILLDIVVDYNGTNAFSQTFTYPEGDITVNFKLKSKNAGSNLVSDIISIGFDTQVKTYSPKINSITVNKATLRYIGTIKMNQAFPYEVVLTAGVKESDDVKLRIRDHKNLVKTAGETYYFTTKSNLINQMPADKTKNILIANLIGVDAGNYIFDESLNSKATFTL